MSNLLFNLVCPAGTDQDSMYTLVSAIHALNTSVAANDMYVSECQDAGNFDQSVVRGNLLICSYSIRFVLGLSTIKQALETANNLSAAGVVFYMDPYVIGFQLNPIPMRIPGIIIPSPDDSKVSVFLYVFQLFVRAPSLFDNTPYLAGVATLLQFFFGKR